MQSALVYSSLCAHLSAIEQGLKLPEVPCSIAFDKEIWHLTNSDQSFLHHYISCRHLVAVVKAWVEISDSESDSDDEQPQNTNARVRAIRGSVADRNAPQAPGASLRIHMPDTGHTTIKPYNQDGIDRLQNVFYGSARFVGKLQHRRKLSKFQFEKYITYLEKVSRNVGFSIGVVLVTWELVSAVFFFLISLIALFLQESIFGKAESTIKI